jgi:hypothetical protein
MKRLKRWLSRAWNWLLPPEEHYVLMPPRRNVLTPSELIHGRLDSMERRLANVERLIPRVRKLEGDREEPDYGA